uniref:RCD1-SRO-TAF4 plant domain protein n=1 Tax=Zea mays TaxID=4577 RepID=A0A1P8YYJ6_MAIZE|nr:RCD1-SRO-TAF4 plant domain protein [Zea mays]
MTGRSVPAAHTLRPNSQNPSDLDFSPAWSSTPISQPPQPVVADAVPVRAHGCTAHVDPHQEVVLEEEHPHPLASTDATTSPVNQFSLRKVLAKEQVDALSKELFALSTVTVKKNNQYSMKMDDPSSATACPRSCLRRPVHNKIWNQNLPLYNGQPNIANQKNEVSKEYFLKTVRNIVGDKLLKQATSQYQMQAQQSPQTNPSNYSLSGQVSGQQTAPSGSVTGDEQKGYPGAHTIPMRQAIASTRPPQFRPSLSGQMRSNTGDPAAPFRPQMADSNPRAHLIQGAVTTVSGSVPTRSIVSGNAPSLKPELFEGLRFDFTKGLNQKFFLSHVFMGSLEVPAQGPETIKVPTAHYEFGANFLDPKLMLIGRVITDGRLNARVKCDLTDNLTLKVNAQFLESTLHLFVQGSDYRAQFQIGNNAFYGANYIQDVTRASTPRLRRTSQQSPRPSSPLPAPRPQSLPPRLSSSPNLARGRNPRRLALLAPRSPPPLSLIYQTKQVEQTKMSLEEAKLEMATLLQQQASKSCMVLSPAWY